MAVSWSEYQNKQKGLRTKLSRGAGGKTPAWVMRMKYFNASATPVKVRLTPMNREDPFFLYYTIWTPKIGDKSRKEVISNSHNGDLPVPDLVWYRADTKQDHKLLAQEKYAIPVTELGDYHEVPRTVAKADGKERTYINYEKCLGIDRFKKSLCKRCDENAAGLRAYPDKAVKYPLTFGLQKYWAFNGKGRDQFVNELKRLRSRCMGCFKGELEVYEYNCQHCGGVLLNRYNDPDASQEDIDLLDAGVEHVECPSCKKPTTGVKKYECGIQAGTSFTKGCANPTPLDPSVNLFDVDITVIANGYDVEITEFELRRSYPQAPATLNLPLPLPDFLSYMTLQEQSNALGMPIPFDNVEACEKVIVDYFSQNQNATATPSEAPSEEADAGSIPWDQAQ